MNRRFITSCSHLLPVLFLLTACQTVKLSTAIEQLEQGNYHQASQTFKKVLRKTDARTERDQRALISWHLANCYDKLMMPQMAVAAYRNAERYGCQEPTLQLQLAKAMQRAGMLKDDAQWNEGSRYVVKRFAITNSRRADFSPAIWGENDDELFYSTSNDKVTGKELSPITGTRYSDIWVTRKDEQGKWQKPVDAGEVNTEADEGTPAFSPDGKRMYYTSASHNSSYASKPQIFVSERTDAAWSKGKLLTIFADTLSTHAHPAVSPDGKWLYFVSDMRGGLGGNDIWRCPLTNGEPGIPENLGKEINTSGNEMFPTFAPDGILYFSSDGHADCLGGLDIYAAREDEWGTWHREHLHSPINSVADDFGMTFCRKTAAKQEGWFSSNRSNNRGYDNIYTFLLPDISIRIAGTVCDEQGEPIAQAIVRVVGRNGMNYKSYTKADGTYEVNIEPATEYLVMSGKEGYLNRKAQFTSDPEEEDADYEVDFYLTSVGVPVLVEDIFYDYNSAKLRPESLPALDELVQLLTDNPYCAIELASHTDRIGSQEYNITLSQQRAESVCHYLISQGIDAARLSPVGYGKSQPVIIDEKLAIKYGFPVGQELTDDFIETLDSDLQQVADQINRRTTFVVTTTTFGL
ncbi:MAG: OmpA family protein [Bacteroidales bacterium]|nr:OmpA family protein [Bacteroidales bacterium]